MSLHFLRERLTVIVSAIVLLVMLLAGSVAFPNFTSPRVLANLITDNAFLGVVVIGLTFVILTGGIDLSLGSLVGLSSVLTATLLERQHWNLAAAILLPLAVGTAVGLAHGFLIAKYELQPFLVTLAGLFLCRGIAFAVSKESVQINDPGFTAWAGWRLALPGKASVTLPTLVFLVGLVIAAVAAKQTRFGRCVLAIGGNQHSAKLMGLPVQKTPLTTYGLSGFCSALGGVLFALYTSSGNPVAGGGLELDAIAAVVIGGTMLSGGYGSVTGSLLGVCVLGTVQNLITFQGTLSSWWTKIFTGAMLLAFILAQRVIEAMATRRIDRAA